MSEHTPGPWHITCDEVGAGGLAIAHVYDDEANAHLIAAAPDLLEGAGSDEICRYTPEDMDRAVSKLNKAAIAKAKGE